MSGRRLQAEMDVLQQKYIDMQEGQDSLMTALDRWNLSQTNKIKLNIDNRLLVSLEHCSDRGSWLLREIYLIESKGRDEGAQNGVRVVPFDPFEAIEQTWDWIHTAAPPGAAGICGCNSMSESDKCYLSQPRKNKKRCRGANLKAGSVRRVGRRVRRAQRQNPCKKTKRVWHKLPKI